MINYYLNRVVYICDECGKHSTVLWRGPNTGLFCPECYTSAYRALSFEQWRAKLKKAFINLSKQPQGACEWYSCAEELQELLGGYPIHVLRYCEELTNPAKQETTA